MSSPTRDPVCGMMPDPGRRFSAGHDGVTYLFCSSYCRDAFVARPEPFLAAQAPTALADDPSRRRIAYFSMEIGIDPRLPIYSGGLGVLAGDTLRSFADLRMPAVGVSLLYRRGYFRQTLDAAGNQREHPVEWNPADALRLLPAVVTVAIEGRPVTVRAWQYEVRGVTAWTVPIVLLDTDVEQNAPVDRELGAWLYGGDQRYRLAQEIVLGIGGIRMLRALGYRAVERFHMNEGHASLLALELLREQSGGSPLVNSIDAVRRQCVFTTHTPVPAGHDQFPYELVAAVLGSVVPLDELRMLGGQEQLNMTRLALNLASYVNGVAKRHGEVSQQLFPGYAIDAVTNGVHSFTWTCDAFRRLYDRRIPGWAGDPFLLRHAIKIPSEEVWAAHLEAKGQLLEEVRRRTSRSLVSDALTIGFARRATAYKRADLVFRDTTRLVSVARQAGPLQLVFAGKAHPRDEPGKDLIRRIFHAADAMKHEVAVVYLEDYDIALARVLTSGVDLWLNTPLRPLEASGTSGMKAAHNGVPSLSVLDGWWIEGHVEGMTGWSIGRGPGAPAGDPEEESQHDAADIYEKLERLIVPLFYRERAAWIDVMRRAIALNASFFNSHRMVQQYATNAYV